MKQFLTLSFIIFLCCIILPMDFYLLSLIAYLMTYPSDISIIVGIITFVITILINVGIVQLIINMLNKYKNNLKPN